MKLTLKIFLFVCVANIYAFGSCNSSNNSEERYLLAYNFLCDLMAKDTILTAYFNIGGVDSECDLCVNKNIIPFYSFATKNLLSKNTYIKNKYNIDSLKNIFHNLERSIKYGENTTFLKKYKIPMSLYNISCKNSEVFFTYSVGNILECELFKNPKNLFYHQLFGKAPGYRILLVFDEHNNIVSHSKESIEVLIEKYAK